MKNTFRLFIIFLSAALLFLGACGGGSPAQGGDAPKNADDTPAAEDAGAAPESNLISDNLPGFDFGGYEFRVLNGVFPTFVNDLYYPEAQIGEVLNDAFYSRNIKIEERFNVRIKAVPLDLFKLLAELRKE